MALAETPVISRYTAVVDREEGPLMQLVPHLQELGFKCLRVPSAEACGQLLHRFPKLSWVAVNSEELEDCGESLLSTAQAKQPNMPILWLDQNSEGQGLHAAVRRVKRLPPSSEIASLVDEALRSRFYSDELVNCLRENSERSLASLDTFAAMREPFIKASLVRLSELNAVLTFRGENAAGHLLVSCRQLAVRYAASQLFGIRETEVTRCQISDILGEIANRIVGGLMPFFDSQGAPVNFGLPLFVGAGDAAMWNVNGAPSLGLEFEGAHGAVFVELALTEFVRGPAPLLSDPSLDTMEPGTCLFQ